eukprot:15432323-Alexandrium_andersonii.AAC.1
MSHASSDVGDAYAMLQDHPDHVGHCVECSAPLSRPGVVVADAGQAFEELDVSWTVESATALFDDLRAMGVSTVAVKQCTQLRGFVGACRFIPRQDHHVFDTSELLQCLLAALAMRLYRCGD